MQQTHFEDPPITKFFFANSKMAWLWLLVRLYVGYAWLTAGWGKIGSPAWTGDSAGASIEGFVTRALSKAVGDHPDVTGWYAWFLEAVVNPNASAWAHAVAYGEFLVGVGLILGALTGIAAFFGLVMNLSFLLAGTVSSNPVLFTLAILLVLAWKVAGYYGVDNYLLPALGTPWQPGHWFRRR
ncbi:MAG: DoxX family protein [Candidatus Harrisonbacteria bacterium CG10_big_fil_rev_8_21_14_0_10_49_15]|uniref:DoxX family protein n=1 Tax=Candidatus Harrisonbacteria bacterium CG10_big_fil_rev_8_21_14_0_10_49_15 TaxID=1974587 RepID=A0A2H0UK93_9BACT|nr:MAG: DoxX family protein [Candidatus Harrisonbacteria bacterium CG10_big_fil_rev_8_21_14_0_10_49_15]